MEQLEVPSKSYLIRWVPCAADYTISWSVQPHKKSLNFGIFRHPKGEATAGTPTLTPLAPTPTTAASPQRPVTRGGRNEGDCKERLHQAGLLDVYWHGKCEADKATTGTFRNKGGEGMFALVFDNTFSKQVAKTCTFISYTYPSNQPAPTNHHVTRSDAGPTLSQASLVSGNLPPNAGPRHAPSVESIGIHVEEDHTHRDGAGFFTGVLKKRKRKRHQGYARRFFSLDFTTSTLSYYLNRESSALRGAIPLSLAAISTNGENLEICIDSGAEVWHLRALSQEDWKKWTSSLEKATSNARTMKKHRDSTMMAPPGGAAPAGGEAGSAGIPDERVWATIETLVGRVSGIRDSVRRLSEMPSAASSTSNLPTPTTPAEFQFDAAGSASKRHFWKRRPLTNANSTPNLYPATQSSRPSISAALGGVSAIGVQIASVAGQGQGEDIQKHLDALLGDLNQVVDEFSLVIKENRHRKWHRQHDAHKSDKLDVHQHTPELKGGASTGRHSMESSFSEQEFFDAEEGVDGNSRVGFLNDSGDEREDDKRSMDDADDDAATSDEEDSFDETADKFNAADDQEATKDGETRDLSPLPHPPVPRRTMVPDQHVQPPSLIGFLRKNVGKDLSTIAMPVSANEPTSLLQRLSEQLEYAPLLDAALAAPLENGSRLLHIAAFAITSFSYARLRERTLRKPFNPMLGETFELTREDLNFRFLAEKVSHRPVIMACHAESPSWTFSQSPMPTQKFWGKSAELNTTGRVRIFFPSTSDSFSYTLATSFLRNIIAGEKYVEPVGTMTIHHEPSGDKAVVTFKEGRMFSGRSEDLDVRAFRSDGSQYPLTMSGKWTSELTLSDGTTIWRIGSALPDPALHYGFTTFAAQLNEITPLESPLCPTDSRLRPDQRLVEEGRIDDAEAVKHQLEEGQRRRRREMEERGEEWTPRWFFKVGSNSEEECWRIRGGEGGYWETRKRVAQEVAKTGKGEKEVWLGTGGVREVFERD